MLETEAVRRMVNPDVCDTQAIQALLKWLGRGRGKGTERVCSVGLSLGSLNTSIGFLSHRE